MRKPCLMKHIKLNWNLQRGGEELEKIPSVGEVWIFSGTAHNLHISISGRKQINLRTWLYLKLYSTYSHIMFPSTSEKDLVIKT